MNLRKAIIDRLVKTFEDKGVEIDMQKLRDLICIEHGSSSRTANEYLRIARIKFEHSQL